MKKNFKGVVSVSVGFLLIASVVLPVVGLAATRVQKDNAAVTPAKAKGFCTLVSGLSSKIDQRLTEHENKIQERRTERTTNLKQRRDERDKDLTEFREKWNDNREEFYAKLEEKADTSVKKQALEKFKAAVESAVKTRRAKKRLTRQNQHIAMLFARRSKRPMILVYKVMLTRQKCARN
jgi:hypothetical protein